MKEADSSTRLKPGEKHSKNTPAAPQPGKARRADARSPQHRANQDDLGIGADHRTDEMEKDKRGTFP